MKLLDRFILTIFSFIMILLSVISILVLTRVLDITTIYFMISSGMGNELGVKIAIGVFIFFILLAIKAIFLRGEYAEKDYEEFKESIVLENDDGRLVVSKDTLVNLVDGAASSFKGVSSVDTKLFVDQNMDISVIETIEVTDDTVLKDISNNMQLKIKEVVKKAIDLELKKIDIRIKNSSNRTITKVSKKDNFSVGEIGNFFKSFGGAIIGAIIAIIILCTRLYEVIIWVLFIVLGMFIGNYVQHNKEYVKEKLKDFIDKL